MIKLCKIIPKDMRIRIAQFIKRTRAEHSEEQEMTPKDRGIFLAKKVIEYVNKEVTPYLRKIEYLEEREKILREANAQIQKELLQEIGELKQKLEGNNDG
jgi:vacuolar-type H+-ATPase subunit I/STV1